MTERRRPNYAEFVAQELDERFEAAFRSSASWNRLDGYVLDIIRYRISRESREALELADYYAHYRPRTATLPAPRREDYPSQA